MALNRLFCADVPLSNYSLTIPCVTVHIVLLSFPVTILVYVGWMRVVGCTDYWYIASRKAAIRVTVGQCVQQAWSKSQRNVAVYSCYCRVGVGG